MEQSVISSLAKAQGIGFAAVEILRRDPETQLSVAGERFFVRTWERLEPEIVIRWLRRSEHEGIARPTEAITSRVLDFLVQVAAAPNGATLVRHHVSTVPDELVRDDLVRRLLGRVSPEVWRYQLPFAFGCPIFLRVVEVVNSQWPCPPWVNADALTAFVTALFEFRRDEPECRKRLRAFSADSANAATAVWLGQEIGELSEVAGAVAALAEGTPSICEARDSWERGRHHLDLAASLADTAVVRAALTRRAIAAAERGVSWGYIWCELPRSLRDHVAVASVGTVHQAPWACAALRRGFTGAELAAKLVALASYPLRKADDLEQLERASDLHPSITEEDRATARDEFSSSWHAWALFKGLRLSDDIDEGLARRVEDVFLSGVRVGSEALVSEEIAGLPLTKDRAQRIIDLYLPTGHFYRLSRCMEIAERVGLLGGEVPRPKFNDPCGLQAYAVLAGAAAIPAWFCELAEGGDFWNAMELATRYPSIRTPQVDATLMRIVPTDDVCGLVHLRREHPWLVSEQQVVATALNAASNDEQWMRLAQIPDYLEPVARAKAAATHNPDLAGRIIERLCRASGKSSARELLRIGIERVEAGGVGAIDARVIGQLLDSGGLWEKEGFRLAHWCVSDVSTTSARWFHDVVIFATRSADAVKSEARRRPSATSVKKTVHSVLAEVMIDAAQAALEASDVVRGRRLLRGLTRLSVPPRLVSKIRRLKNLRAAEPLLDLMDANDGLARTPDAAYETGYIFDALLIAAGAVPDDEIDDGDDQDDDTDGGAS